MSPAATGARPGPWAGRPLLRIDRRRLMRAALWLAVFLGGFVIEEPAPYELFLVFLLVVWAPVGLRLRPAFGPMIVLYLLFITGGLLATTQARDFGEALMYITVTGFLAVTAMFFAAVVAADHTRVDTIRSAVVASAVIVAALGILGYFHAFPGAEVFTLYDRAKGTFQDPNVFGPFLVLPTALLLRDMLTKPLRSALLTSLPLLILVFGVFLSFSRAAWGLLVLSGLLLYLIVFICEARPARRQTLLFLAGVGVIAAAVLFAVALSFDSISAMFFERAKLVQSYDAARLGRFARYALGFSMVMDHPLGLGPLEFRHYFPEDEHNTYMKAFTTYGWIGGLSYIALVGWTIARLFPLAFQPRPWQAFAQCVFAVLVGHALISAVIDTDRWRHLYLLYGVAWGMIALEAGVRERIRRRAVAGTASAQPHLIVR